MSEDQSADDKTEDATPERREDAREKGQAVLSRELTSVAILAASCAFAIQMAPRMIQGLEKIFVQSFESVTTRRVDRDSLIEYFGQTWIDAMIYILPMFAVVAVVAIALTYGQTRILFSWEKLKPDFSRMNPLTGVARMVNTTAVTELVKGIAKMTAVGLVAYAILHSEWRKLPELMTYPIISTWTYWGDITKQLFWSVSALLLVIGGFDYFVNYFSFEKSLRMSKHDIKEEYKKREVDPHVKARIRRMARDLGMKKTLEKTREATVLITNPTHYSIALSYELGMGAPVLVAKGMDFIALEMREIAKEMGIPIIENRPLARELYATVKEGEEVPDKLYKVVAEIIRYVFKLKGKALGKKAKPKE